MNTFNTAAPIFKLLIFIYLFGQTLEVAPDIGCPKGSYRLDNKCYSVSTWTESNYRSELYCKMRGGNLAAVKTPKIHMFLQKLRLEIHLGYWIGLNRDLEGQWHYSDGSKIEYSKWAPGTPNTSSSNACAFMQKSNSHWYDGDCNFPLHYVCQFEDAQCDYSKRLPTFGNYCFETSRDMLSCYDAAEKCRLKGGSLLKINTTAMYEFARDMLLKDWRWFNMEDDLLEKLVKIKIATQPAVWIGLKYREREETWVFSDGTISNFTLWQQGEPNNSLNSEECVGMNEGWFDAICDRTDLYFACEYKATPSIGELVQSNPRMTFSQSSDGKTIVQNIWNIFNSV